MARICILVAFCGVVTAAQGSNLSSAFGPATGYNAFVSGNFSDGCCDVGGNLAVGGTTNVNGFAVGQSYVYGSPSAVPFSYVGMGKLTGSFSLDGGNGYYGGGGPFNIYVKNGSQSVSTTGGSGIDFAAAQASLTQYANFLYGLSPTTTATQAAGGGFAISAQNTAQTNIVTLTAAQLAAGALHIDLAGGATLLINVIADGNGSAATSNNGIFVNGAQSFGDGAPGADRIVFNFIGSDFHANETIVGTVLAPYATFTGSYQQVDGGLIAKNVAGGTEFHDDLFRGTLPTQTSTPEPVSFVLLGSGLLAIGAKRAWKH